MNSVNLIGRLGRDPELKYTPQGTAVCTFSVAVDAGRDKPADWFDIVVWEKQAETAAQHLAKGRQVGISGRLQTRSYEGRDGQKRKVVEIVATRVDFVGPKPQDGGAPAAPSDDADDGDVPF